MKRSEFRQRQLGLFGAPPPPESRARSAVGPAAVAAELREIAGTLPQHVRLGTSSWSFPGWNGIVYDRQASPGRLARHGLAAYARHPLLRAVGVDRTFYAPVEAALLAEYAAAVPEDFRFVVKAAQHCTSPYQRDPSGRPAEKNSGFLDPGFAAEQVVAPYLEGLGAKGGALLFQFPPLGAAIGREASRFAERLGRFLGALPAGPRYAVELRDADLLCTDYFCVLQQAGASHCVNLHPRMPPVEEQVALAGPALEGPLVVRWMLHAGQQYDAARERYAPFSALVDEDPASRRAVSELCLEHAARGHDVIVVANNKAEGSAPLSLFALARQMARPRG